MTITLFIERIWDSLERLSYNLKIWVSMMFIVALTSTIAGASLDGMWAMIINGVVFALLSLAGAVVVVVGLYETVGE